MAQRRGDHPLSILKNSWPGVAALFLLAFVLRAGYSLSSASHPIPPDAGSFDAIAWNVASQGRYLDSQQLPTATRTPSYVLFEAAVYKLAGHSYTAVRLAQAVLGSILVLLLMALSRRFTTDPRAPWISGAIAAVYPFFIYYESDPISDAFLTFGLVLSVLLFFRWREDPRSWLRAIACGVAFAVVCLTKTIFIPYLLMLIGVEMVVNGSRMDRLQRAMGLALIGAIVFAPILAWGFRNQRQFGHFTLDTHGGLTSFITVVHYRECKQGVWGEYLNAHPELKSPPGMNEAEADAYYAQLTKRFILENPGVYLRQNLGNLKNFWRLYPRQDLAYAEGRLKITLISLLTEPFLLILGLMGLIQTRKNWRTLYPAYLLILLLTGVHTLLTAQMRYRLPIMPFAILFTTCALTAWWRPKSS